VYGSDYVSGQWAALFNGNVRVMGTIEEVKGLGVVMDNPRDPRGKYLRQAAVVAPERLVITRGTAGLDAQGQAWVTVPEWFASVTTDLSYHLTPIGAAMPSLHVAEELGQGRFRVAGGEGGMKVSWQVTGARADPWALDNPLEVVAPKPADEVDTYLHPQGYGADEQLSLELRLDNVHREHLAESAATVEEE